MSTIETPVTWREWLQTVEAARQGAGTPEACREWMATYAGRLIELAKACAEVVESAARLAETCDPAALGGRGLQRLTEAHEAHLRNALAVLAAVAGETRSA